MNEDFIEEKLIKAKTLSFFGTPILEMTREELIACCVLFSEEEIRSRKEKKKERYQTLEGMRSYITWRKDKHDQ